MAYTPDPTNPAQPVESVLAQTAAAEFRALKAYLQQIVSSGGLGVATPGQIVMFPATVAPPGWLELDGSVRLRSTFPNLWNAVVAMGGVVAQATYNTNTWGLFGDGDGSTTFTLPDWRGQFPRAWNHGRTGTQFDPSRPLGQTQNASAVYNSGGLVSIEIPQTGSMVDNSDEQRAISVAYAGVTFSGTVTGSRRFDAVRPTNIATMFCVKI